MIRRRLAVATILAVGLAGCGSSGLSPAAYRAKATQLCMENNSAIEAVPASTANTVAGLEKLDGIASGTLKQLKAISPPSSLSGKVSTWLGDITQESTGVAKVISEVKSGQRAKAQSLAESLTPLNAKGDAAAKAVGVPACAVNAEPGG